MTDYIKATKQARVCLKNLGLTEAKIETMMDLPWPKYGLLEQAEPIPAELPREVYRQEAMPYIKALSNVCQYLAEERGYDVYKIAKELNLALWEAGSMSGLTDKAYANLRDRMQQFNAQLYKRNAAVGW